MKQFEIEKLTVWHRLRDVTGEGMPEAHRNALQRNTFFVATCMREFGIASDASAVSVSTDDFTCQLHGQEAYAFLLRTVTGLNSSVPGETNVQGQIRKAWNTWRHQASIIDVAALNPLMHKLFTDSRTIRRHYLEGIGGTSYGSLVRKLLRPAANAKILLIGAGELAQSIAPYFTGHSSAVWNRHATDAAALGVNFAFAPSACEAAAKWATHVVITTPPDSTNDARWANLLNAQTGLHRIAHLGLRRAQRGAWQRFSNCDDLDDLIELRHTQSSIRVARLEKARTACDSIADSSARLTNTQPAARAA